MAAAAVAAAALRLSCSSSGDQVLALLVARIRMAAAVAAVREGVVGVVEVPRRW